MTNETDSHYLNQESEDVFLTYIEQEMKKLQERQKKVGDTPVNEITEEDLKAILKRNEELGDLGEERQKRDQERAKAK